MNSEIEKKFDKIAQDMLEAARQVDCSQEDYFEGLTFIHQYLEEEMQMVEMEIDANNEEE